MILIIILLLLLIPLIYIAKQCLNRVILPQRYDKESLREEEIRDGFQAAIDAYENIWQRQPFELDCRGTLIRGEIIRNPDAKENRVAIICHGHTVNRYTDLKYGDIFYRAGYHLVIYDERHFGESEGAISTLGQEEAKDLAEIIAYVKQQFGDCFIALHGESMGAATTLLVLQYVKPDLIVADCPFADSERLFTEWIRQNMAIPPILVIPILEVIAFLFYGYHIRKTSPIRIMQNCEVPICFMHGDSDQLIDCDHSRQLFKACGNPRSELHLFPGAAHARSIDSDPQAYERILLDFLRNNQAL